MRIYQNVFEAFREVERELFEFGIEVHPQTMQDKIIKDDPEYMTKELRGYSFMIVDWKWDSVEVWKIFSYFWPGIENDLDNYLHQEFEDRISYPTNPGNSYKHRLSIWQEFLHGGKFAYTYSERIHPQLDTILEELRANPETRQAIINIHSNICPLDSNRVETSMDILNRGGGGRLPCSMYYQIMIREGRVDLIYTMRSCDFLTHFPIDVLLALKLQQWFASELGSPVGRFTYFTGSLHAYYRDLKTRGIF